MKKRLFRCLLAFALIVGVYLMGTQEVFATAVEQFSLWTTSLRYDLEITEPTLEELADGNGTFTATGVCSESVVGTDISVAVVFYDEQDEMVDYWKTSIILEEHNEITVSGTVPEYASVGVYFFESETMEPIRPSVMRLLDQQITDGDTKELLSALEERMKVHDQAIAQLTQELDSLLNGFPGSVLLSRNDGRRTVTDGGSSNITANVRSTITGFTTYMTKDIMFGDADAIEGIIVHDFRIEEVEGFEKVDLEIQFRNFDASLTDHVTPKSELIKTYTVSVIPNGLSDYHLVVPITKSELANVDEEFILGMRIVSEGSVVRMEFSSNTTCDATIKEKNDQKLDNDKYRKYVGYYTNKPTPSSSVATFYPDMTFSTVKIRDVSALVDATLSKTGRAADAAVVGEALAQIRNELSNSTPSVGSSDQSYDMIQAAEEYIAVEGDTLEIFYKSILHAKNPLNYNIHAYCKVGTSFQEKFVVPSTVSAGVYPLTLTITNDKGELIDQETININVQKKAESPAKTVNVLCMGASTESDGLWINEFYRRLTQTSSVAVTGAKGPTGDGLTNINFIGKRTTNLGAGYEGFGGWSWGSYISTTTSSGSYWVKVNSHTKEGTDQESIYKDANGVLWQLETIEETQLKLKKYGDTAGTMPPSGTLTYVSGGVDTSNIVYKSTEPEKGNPFCYNGKLDFKAYCNDIGASGIDYVYAKLVWNGTPSGTTVTQANLDKRIQQIRTFLDALLADYPNAKLVMTSSPIPSYDGCGTNYTADSTFQNWWYLRDWMYKHQTVIYQTLKEEYPDNIYFCDLNAQFDIDHGYPTVSVAYNTRSSQTYQRQSNGVHPTNEGRMQWSDAAYRHFTKMLNDFPDHFTEDKEEQPTCTNGHSYVNGICADCGSVQTGPVITKQPTDVYAAKGEKFSIKPEVQGEGLTYQWYYKESYQKKFSTSSNKTSAYAYAMQSYMNNRQVYCVITDQYGNQVTTETVTIHVTN